MYPEDVHGYPTGKFVAQREFTAVCPPPTCVQLLCPRRGWGPTVHPDAKARNVPARLSTILT